MAPTIEALANAFVALASEGAILRAAIDTLIGNLGRLASYAATFSAVMAGRGVAGLAAAALSVRGLATALVFLRGAFTGRFTRDIDFLAFGSDEEAELKAAFSQILAIDGGDGLVYDIASLTAVAIREDQIYGGMRLRTEAHLGSTRIPITVALGFGDALADPKFQIEYGSLLDFPAASIRAYSPATVLAEKFQAVVALGVANSRMRDLYDLWTLPKSVEIDIDDLAAAIRGTFARRDTIVPAACPVGLSEEFSADPAKMTQWRAYSDGTALDGWPLAEIWAWLEPAWRAAA